MTYFRYAKAGYYAAFSIPIALLFIDVFLQALMIEKKSTSKLRLYIPKKAAADFLAVAQQWRPNTETGDGNINHSNPDTEDIPNAANPKICKDPSEALKATERSSLLESSKVAFGKPCQTHPIYRLLSHPHFLTALLAVLIDLFVFTAFETISTHSFVSAAYILKLL